MINKYVLPLLIILSFNSQVIGNNKQEKSSLYKLQEEMQSIGNYYHSVNDKLNNRSKSSSQNSEFFI
jgi:hypothetical protein